MNERLTSIEAIMWRAGQDATLRMTVGDLMVLDRAPTRDALVARLAAAAERVPRLRQRPDDLSGVRTRPIWVEDRSFDSADHVQVLAAPSPGGQRELLDLLGLIESRPFNPDRPPWDATLIEGLDGGRAGLYLRAHHALTDGMGGITLISSLLDEEVAPEVEPTEGAKPSVVTAAVEGTGGRRPGTVSVTIDLTRAVGAARGAAAVARNIEPVDTVVRVLQRGLDTVSSVSRQLVVTGGPMSPLPSSRSVTNRFEVISVPGARAAALALGGSRNDLLVAAAAAGVGAYQVRLGLPASELRVAVPTSRRRAGRPGGNWFAPVRVELPTSGEPSGPFFGVVTERLARARCEPAVRLSTSVASAVSRLPTRLLLPALHAQARSVDVVVTSFPGLRGARTICGSRVEESYPFGPRLGCLMNITAFGNGERLDVGIALDPSAISEPELLVECLVSAFNGFAPTERQPAPSRPRAAKP